MTYKVLLVDDDVNLLHGLKRQFRKRFNMLFAEGGREALNILTEHDDIAVVVSDMRMPDVDGLEVLKKVRQSQPDTTRIMLTGNADQQTAVNAVNEGAIFRFFNKPCDHEVLAHGIEDGLRQYQLVTAEKELLEKTLAGTIKFLVDLMSFSNPESFARSTRIRDWIKRLQPQLDLPVPWRLDFAAMLLPLSDLIVPHEIVEKKRHGRPLSDEENASYKQAGMTIRSMISQIPRFEELADILAYVHVGGSHSDGAQIPAEAKILHILDALSKRCPKAHPTEKAFKELMPQIDEYDQTVLKIIRTELLGNEEDEGDLFENVEISIGALRPGYTLLRDVVTTDGRLLLSCGNVLSATHIEKMKVVSKHIEAANTIHVSRPVVRVH